MGVNQGEKYADIVALWCHESGHPELFVTQIILFHILIKIKI